MNYKPLYSFIALVVALLMLIIPLSACENVSLDNSADDSSGEISEVVSNTPSTPLPDEESANSDITSVVDEPSEPPKDTVISFLGCPDVIIHSSVFYDAIEQAAKASGSKPKYNDLHNVDYDFYPIFEYVADAIEQADISYVNQETLPGSDTRQIIGYPCFNSPFDIAYTEIGLGFDVVNVAHNHMLDAGDASYIQNAYKIYTESDLTVIGYYENDEAVDNIPIIERDGIKIAFLAYTYGTNGIRLSASSPVVIPYFSRELLERQIPLAKEQADVVIVSAHWGEENSFRVSNYQKEYAELMCELGVDVVLGMHPHVVQPIEWMTSSTGHKTLVVYSLGNYVSGMKSAKNLLAGMLSLDIVRSGVTGLVSIENAVFIPTVTHYIKVRGVSSTDTGFRDFKIYYLSDYNEELASSHGVVKTEKNKGTTSLVGGGFSYENLVKTLKQYIDPEFLPEEFK